MTLYAHKIAGIRAARAEKLANVRRTFGEALARVRRRRREVLVQDRREDRKRATRVKILWGATLLAWMAEDHDIAVLAKAKAVQLLKRPADLALLGIVLHEEQ